MIYLTRMVTEQHFRYNFKVFKLARILNKLRVVSNDELIRHMTVMERAKPMGLFVDYDNYMVQGAPGEVYQF